MRKIIFEVVGGLLILAGCYTIYQEQSDTMVIISTCLWIAGLTICIMGSPKSSNQMLDTQKIVELPKIPITNLCKALQAVPTPLGHPWLCKIFSVKQPVLVYGPDERGSFIYGRWAMGMFYLSASANTSLLEPGIADKWRLDGGGQRRQAEAGVFYEEEINLAGRLEAYQHIFEFYAEQGKVPDVQSAAQIFGKAGKSHGKLYAFQEDFKLTGQRFQMIDMAGKVIYEVEGTWPLKTLCIYMPGSSQVVFRVTKRIFHLLPHYDFYQGETEDTLLGAFHKKLDLAHDSFTMQLDGQELVMRSVAATIGANYIVRLGGRQIGTIGENLNLTLDNIIFDNMIVEVFDEKYTCLMAALAIMSAREMARDNDGV